MTNQYFTPIIAIDGHAGAGKSTVAKAVAQHLGFWHINTGMFYRAVTWWTLSQGLNINQADAIAHSIQPLQFHVLINASGTQEMHFQNENVTAHLRTEDINENISLIASYAPVRDIVNKWLRAITHPLGIIMDGRDIGTVVAPEAPLKIFLTASVEERARRRLKDIEARGESVDIHSLQETIALRDYKDSQREVAPLVQSKDAILIDSSDLSQEEVISQIQTLWENVPLKAGAKV